MVDNFSLSIIVPTFNRDKYLADTLEAILKQKVQDLEIIVVDDGSTDNTLMIMEPLLIKYSFVSLVKLEENRGESNAVNIGWALAKKRFVSIINSDDPPHENWLSGMISGINLHQGYGFYYPNRLVINEQGNVIRHDVLKAWSTQVLFERLIPIASAGLIIDRSLLPSTFIPRDPQVLFPSDLIQMFRLGLLAKGYKIDDVWGVWREHSDSLSDKKNAKLHANYFEFYISEWLEQHKSELKTFSRPVIRTAYLYGHVWRILRKQQSFFYSSLFLYKSSLMSQIRKNPLLISSVIFITIRHGFTRLIQRDSKIFSILKIFK